MIQRVQSLYLLLAAVLMTLMMFVSSMVYITPLGEISLAAPGYTFTSAETGETTMLVHTTLMRVIVYMSILLPILLIFVYKNREAQLKLCYVEIALVVLAQILVVYYGYFAYGNIIEGAEDAARVFGMGMIMPVAAFILVLLAMRGIKKDINLVKSLDRVR